MLLEKPKLETTKVETKRYEHKIEKLKLITAKKGDNKWLGWNIYISMERYLQ